MTYRSPSACSSTRASSQISEYDGNKAIGLISRGSGDCTSGGTTFFQPVTEALSVYGVSLL